MIVNLKNDYEPSEKGALFHSSSARFKILRGGLGSGKTRMAVEEVKILMAEHDGLEGFVMRKTMPSLRDSTLNEFLKFMPDELGRYNGRFEQFECVNGSKLMFRGLDQPSKIKSTNVGLIVLDEAEEFTREDFLALKGRLRQTRVGKPYPLTMIMIFNPVDEDHWLFQEFEVNGEVYNKEGGLLHLELSSYDNEKHLPPGYIEMASAGLTPDEKERLIWGRWGRLVRGEPVYGKLINEFHFEKWAFNESMLLIRGWDFGFNRPACVWKLKDPSGRKNIDHELLGDKEQLVDFARRVIFNTQNRYGKYVRIFDYCDPRGNDKSDKGEDGNSSSVEILQNEFGITATGERGIRDYVEPGIQMVRKELSTLIGGRPELTINPECKIIKAAIGGRYVRDEDGNPKKDKFYEHLMDALRYNVFLDKNSSGIRDAIIERAKRLKAASSNARRYTGYR